MMDSYSVTTDHKFEGQAYYRNSGTYKWNIIEKKTGKIVLSITDVAEITYNCYSEHVLRPSKVIEVIVKGNIVYEILKEKGNEKETTYLYELVDDKVEKKELMCQKIGIH